MKYSIIIALFCSTFVWSQEKVIFVAKNENIKSTKIQIDNGMLRFVLIKKLGFLHVSGKHLQKNVVYSNITDNIVSDLEDFKNNFKVVSNKTERIIYYKNKRVKPFIYIEFAKGLGAIFEVEWFLPMWQEYNTTVKKFPDSLSGLYKISDKNTSDLIDEVLLLNNSCRLYKNNEQINDTDINIKLEYSANRNIAAKFRIGRFELSLLYSKKMFVRDNLCIDCPEILFDKKQ